MRSLLKGPPPAGMEKPRKRYQELRSRIVDERLGQILDQLWRTLSSPPNERQTEPRAAVVEKVAYLLERGMHGVSDVLFLVNVSAFPADAASDVLNSAPSPETLKRWVSAAGVDPKAFAIYFNSIEVYLVPEIEIPAP